MSNAPLGNVRDASLEALWRGRSRGVLASRLDDHDYSSGCQGCGAQVDAEGRAGSYPATFDRFGARARGAELWPSTMYLNLSNVCNLQCVQCDGELSSSIRRHRERLPAVVSPYGDEFFDQLAEFIPHLDELDLAGGEPFLAAETFRVLEMVEALAPELRCRVITNGTQWNRRVADVLDRLRLDITLSLDAITAETYERIRVGADFAEVMGNLDRFRAYCDRVGTTFAISHCLMVANAAEFPDLLLFAESIGSTVSVSVVRDPREQSIVHLPSSEIADLHRALAGRHEEMSAGLVRNLPVWTAELGRLAVWAEAGSAALRGHDQHKVMWFLPAGAGPVDDRSAAAELRSQSIDGQVAAVRVGRGQLILGFVDDPTALLGPAAADLVGQHVRSLFPPLAERFGDVRSMADIEVRHQTPDRVEQVAVFPGATLRILTVAMRDQDGWAEEARILIARVA